MDLLLQFSSYSFETLGHGLKICILFGHNPQIIFCYFFHKKNLVTFDAKVNGY